MNVMNVINVEMWRCGNESRAVISNGVRRGGRSEKSNRIPRDELLQFINGAKILVPINSLGFLTSSASADSVRNDGSRLILTSPHLHISTFFILHSCISTSLSQFDLTFNFCLIGTTFSGWMCLSKNSPGSQWPLLLLSYKMRSSYSPGGNSLR